MMKRYVKFTSLLICFLIIFSLNNIVFCTEDQVFTLWEESKENVGKKLFYQTREMFSYQSSNLREIEKNLVDSENHLQLIKNQQERLYWLARVKYLQGLIEKNENNSLEAENDFNKSRELIMNLLEQYEFSDGYRLLADIEGQLMFYRDLFYKTKYGPQIKIWAEKAILLNPTNYQAYITLALYFYSAPSIVGGDPKKGKEVLNRIIQLDQSGQIDPFSLFLWLITAFENTNFNQIKLEKYLKPLELFSNQEEIQAMVSKLSKKYGLPDNLYTLEEKGEIK